MGLFVVNPRAGGGVTALRWPAIAAHLTDLGVAVETRWTETPGEATAIARDAARSGERLVVAVGGDGTIHEVVNGLMAVEAVGRPELGILPCGTGGDLIRSLGIPRNPYEAARAFARHQTRAIDAGHVAFQGPDGQAVERHFVNVAEAGVGGAIVERVNRTTKKLGGFATYLLGTLATVATYRPSEMAIALDDEPARSVRAWNVVIGNGGYFGGGMRILPDARVDDGWFDVLVIGDLSRRALALNLASVYPGTHLKQPGVELRRARVVTVSAQPSCLLDLDGEQPGMTEARFTIVPSALSVRI
jgi:YegS/Rv2252/BmrU family lipid kinase